MAAYLKFNSFVEDLAEGVHNFEADQFVIALTPASDPPNVNDDGVGDLVEIDYTNFSSRNILVVNSGQVNGVYRPIFNDLVLIASGQTPPFRFVAVYNDTSAFDPLVAFYDVGFNVILQDGETFTVDFDADAGLFSLT